MTGAAYMQDMFEETEDVEKGRSEVANFYSNQNVLITGGFGFLGRLLIEKILRSCSDVKTLFVFLRAKKGQSSEKRFNELFKDAVFDRLKVENPGFARQVVLIDGDMQQVGLGLSADNRELLRSTHIIIHGAATVRFNEKLRIAINNNVRGTKELMQLATDMPDLKAFVHISTAYSNCVYPEIDEKFYPSPIDSEKLLELLDILDDNCLDHLTPVLLGKWPNTYAFTKAVAEDIVRRNIQSLPICIVRPSIVVSTAKEPVAGWTNNVYGATGIFIGAGIGLMRTLHCEADNVADLIPADYVVNTVIVAAWDTGKSKNVDEKIAGSATVPEIKEPRIYNSVSSCQSPVTWGKVSEYNTKYMYEAPSVKCLWYFCFRFNRHRWIHILSIIFLHLLPALVVDTLAKLSGKKPMLWAAYKKIHMFSSITEYFTLRKWTFHNNNVMELEKNLNPTDRVKFEMNISNLNWEDYCHDLVRGLRIYILKDPLDSAAEGRIRFAKLKVAHYTLVTVFLGLLLWLFSTLLRIIGFW